ncbi:MAG: hypothetical protein K6F37_09425 [Lachnospiraceae bacterium]|nr:hypothetical protein [Lachnospiraceae bacterium]
MKKSKRIIALFLSLVLAVGCLLVPSNVKAATATAKETTRTVIYNSQSYSGITDITINKKSPSKVKKDKTLKKAVTVTQTATDKQGFGYVDVAYTAGNIAKKYLKTKSYSIEFKKAGTYTVKYKTYYNKYSYSFRYATSDYTLTTTDNLTGKQTTSAGFTWKSDVNGNSYYENAAGAIYAYSDDEDSYVKATLDSTGALLYQGREYGEKEVTRKVIVTGTTPVVKKISLGNASYEYTRNVADDKTYSYTSKIKDQLSGKKGKLSVSMGDGYAIKDIIVMTYDKDGNEVYKLVKNNKTVTFGAYAYKSEYSSSYSSQYTSYTSSTNRVSTRMFKETRVYVFYKDKKTGGYTDIKKIEKKTDDDGKPYYEFTYKTLSSKGGTANTNTTNYISNMGGFYSLYTFIK